jgi:hypothetical protein
MADSKKYCTECFLPVPPDWNKKYCPSCGGRVKLKLVKKRHNSQGHSRIPETTEPNREKKSRPFPLSRKLIKQDTRGIFVPREKSVLGPRFQVMSPALLFALNIFTFGVRSAFWLVNRMPSLLMMAKMEEKNIKSEITLWSASFCASFTLSALSVFNVAKYDLGLYYLTESSMARAAVSLFVLAFLLNRHMLYWSREVIIDELLKNELDFIRSRAVMFAPSALLIWFLGIPYIQIHINRMIKKKGLNAYKPSRGVRVRKSSSKDWRQTKKPELTPELSRVQA